MTVNQAILVLVLAWLCLLSLAYSVHTRGKSSGGENWQRAHSRAQLWFNGLLVSFTAIYAAISAYQAYTMRGTLRVSERPWVSASLRIGSDMVFTDREGANVWLEYTLKNSGHSPAVGTGLGIALSLQIPWEIDVAAERKGVCAQARETPVGPPWNLGGFTLFPGDEKRDPAALWLEPAKINSAIARGATQPTVIGCIAY